MMTASSASGARTLKPRNDTVVTWKFCQANTIIATTNTMITAIWTQRMSLLPRLMRFPVYKVLVTTASGRPGRDGFDRIDRPAGLVVPQDRVAGGRRRKMLDRVPA